MGEQPRTRERGGRVYLDVPYAEKEAAKQVGARWDQPVKRWYARHGLTPALQQWVALPEVREVLPGENRTFGEGCSSTWCRGPAGSPTSAAASATPTGSVLR